jgi:hypothetical protein
MYKMMTLNTQGVVYQRMKSAQLQLEENSRISFDIERPNQIQSLSRHFTAPKSQGLNRLSRQIQYLPVLFGILNRSTKCPGRTLNEDVRERNLNKRNSERLNPFLIQTVIFAKSHRQTCKLEPEELNSVMQ